MRFARAFGVALVLGGVAVFGSPPAEAGADLVVKRFLLGRIEPGTGKFVATGARGTTNAFRDNVILLVFSTAVDLETVTGRTVEIGIPTAAGNIIEAEGAFRAYTVNRFNPVSGTYDPKRTYRNRVIFDPRAEDEALCPMPGLEAGFEADTLYGVNVPGVDLGYTKTLRGTRGQPNLVTFTTYFRTTASFLNGTTEPTPHVAEAVGGE